ncbi:hypothetical protein ASPWEDRAFT_169203 [Aspergillus wentii DTO 134E9]|uniref:RING-type domain-containing protein n=1 Tax=Aspergillus wentii DTO 134E9 TaxID=1073089 RepID=A0A1L9RWN2_ASPWE|nr:uncharacterized protein ASPWEDRAFT_169203 [Aspergillus wentii DTO 134E9]KAI9928963.1 hypothetical protein MW887_001356 [Aspergillus wentii]OJJ39350.1 hypothetical protein ASPWEDRAFT_169203 [Aspergillus wentii DTO 134E9]
MSLSIVLFVVCTPIPFYLFKRYRPSWCRCRCCERADPPPKTQEDWDLEKLDCYAGVGKLKWWFAVKKKRPAGGEFICAFCLDPVLDRQLVRKIRCRHVFHKERLETWYLKKKHQCPTCQRYFIWYRFPLDGLFV